MTFTEAIGRLEQVGLPAGPVRLQVSLLRPDSPPRIQSQALEAYVRLRDAHDLSQVRRLGLEQPVSTEWAAALRRVREEVQGAIHGLRPEGLTWEQLLGTH